MSVGLIWGLGIIIAIAFVAIIVLLSILLARMTTAPASLSGFDELRGNLDSLRDALTETKTLLGEQSKTVKELRESVDSKLTESSRTIAQQLTKNLESVGKTFAEVSKELGQLGEASERILEVGKDIGGLKDLLQPPKARGGLGEVMLEQLLGNVLPREHYEMQYSLGSERVDAIVKLPEGLVPVDSKFPLPAFERILAAEDENERKKERREFLRDVRNRIDEIAGKYIKPELGTVDFALMYIPAENVYYEAVSRDEGGESILEYGLAKKVIPVSPFTFYAYLVALAYGLKGMRVAEHAKVIRQQLAELSRTLGQAQEDFDTLGRHLRNAANKYDETGKHFADFAFKLEQYAAAGGGEEAPEGLPPAKESEDLPSRPDWREGR